ncbi:hypothetical protein [Leptolyngbya sp. ST-U4]|uniref:hypothetical protein n=1 Tax=Leptolyngbya sp. ST-U4 TaxID=2933912 RepID=UPI0019C18DA0|nr:hypothetical protein [Cyanobacteria bacterium FACHB-502]MBD2025331.1 hypothetical protein [Leptolyngbya sp. FACHB-711]
MTQSELSVIDHSQSFHPFHFVSGSISIAKAMGLSVLGLLPYLEAVWGKQVFASVVPLVQQKIDRLARNRL